MRFVYSIAFILALVSFVTLASAQPKLEFKAMRTVGPVPSISLGMVTSETRISGFSMDPIGQRLHWVLNNDWYRLHLPTRTWTRHSIQNGFDLYVPRWAAVPGKLELLAWDNGLGRVVRIDSNGVPTRLDKSFNQKTQYGHLHHVEEDGTIHAIGGLGLYHAKNYAVSFSESSFGWHRTIGDERIATDPYLAGGHTLKDPVRSELILFGHFGEIANPKIPGILTMNTAEGPIRILHRDTPVRLQSQFYNFSSSEPTSVHDGSHRIAFAMAGNVPNQPLLSRLIAIDLDTYRITELTGLNESSYDPGTYHMVLHYSEADSSLYSIQWTHLTIDFVNFVTVSKAKVDVDAVKAALRSGIRPEGAQKAESKPTFPLFFSFFAAVAGLAVGFILARRLIPSASDSTLTADRQILSIQLNPMRLNGLPWIDRAGSDSELESKLLELLAEATASGQPVISSDTIDRLLIPNHPSPDYIRKTRNHTRKRLEEILQDVFPATEPYILAERDVIDKRKTKLQLNPELVMVSRPE